MLSFTRFIISSMNHEKNESRILVAVNLAYYYRSIQDRRSTFSMLLANHILPSGSASKYTLGISCPSATDCTLFVGARSIVCLDAVKFRQDGPPTFLRWIRRTCGLDFDPTISGRSLAFSLAMLQFDVMALREKHCLASRRFIHFPALKDKAQGECNHACAPLLFR